MDFNKYLTEEDSTFRESLSISKSNLVAAIKDFAVITFDINYQIAIVEDSYNKSKRELEKISALRERSDKNRAKIDKEKITEKDLERSVKLSSLYDKEYIKFLELKKALAILKAKSKSLEAKEKMISNAVYLLQREIKASNKN